MILFLFILVVTGMVWGWFLNIIASYMMYSVWKVSFSPITLFIQLIAIFFAYTLTSIFFSWETPLLFHNIVNFMLYTLFFSALIIAVRTDLESLVIFDATTIGPIPIALLATSFNYLDVNLFESITGALFGYCFLWLVGYFFFWCTGKKGIGEGDFEVLALIGAYLGPLGCWLSLMFASISGVILGLFYLYVTGTAQTIKIPFVPFLFLGASIYFFHQDFLVEWFFFS